MAVRSASNSSQVARIELPPKLIPVFSGQADIRAAWGGRGSGKTRTFAKMTAIRAYMWDQAHREGIILCGRQFMNSLDDSSMEEIKAAIRSEDWLAAQFEIGEKFIRTKSGRVAYKFTGLDRHIDSIKSKSRILLCWVDEAEPVTEEAWAKLIPTLREEDSELWVTWNPESKRSPTHKRFRLGASDRIRRTEINWRDNPWFPSILDRTRQDDLRERPDTYAHIWEGDFATVFEGAYYAREMNAALTERRIRDVPVDEHSQVHTAWDLGVGDSMVVWFWQAIGPEIRVVDYYEANGYGIDHYADIIEQRAKAGRYERGDDFVPHDARQRSMTSTGTDGKAKQRLEVMIECGLKPKVVPIHRVEDGISAVRQILARCWFDEKKTEQGIEALRHYRPEYDDDKQTFSDKPRHDWASHPADGFRTLAMAWKGDKVGPVDQPRNKTELELIARPDGTVKGNLNVREAVEAMVRRRRGRD